MSSLLRSLTGRDVADEFDGLHLEDPAPRTKNPKNTRNAKNSDGNYRPHHATPDEYHDTHTAAEWHDIIEKVTPVYDKWLKQGYVFLHFLDKYGEDPHISEEFAKWAPLLAKVLDLAPEEFLIEVEDPEPPVDVGEDDDLYDLFQFMDGKPKAKK